MRWKIQDSHLRYWSESSKKFTLIIFAHLFIEFSVGVTTWTPGPLSECLMPSLLSLKGTLSCLCSLSICEFSFCFLSSLLLNGTLSCLWSKRLSPSTSCFCLLSFSSFESLRTRKIENYWYMFHITPHYILNTQFACEDLYF